VVQALAAGELPLGAQEWEAPVLQLAVLEWELSSDGAMEKE
jgi:hypothetical protein